LLILRPSQVFCEHLILSKFPAVPTVRKVVTVVL
jgi:hypothetical protein